MSRSLRIDRPVSWLARPWIDALACLVLATIAGLVLAQLLLSPTARDLRALALYLALSGAVTIALGWLALRLADRAVRLGIQAKVFLAGLIGSGVGLINVFIVAKLMFLSNVHDLRLLVALLVFSGVLTTFFNLWVAVTTTGRVEAAAGGIRALVDGDYRADLTIAGRDEVARLGQRVNELAARLREAEEERAALERERRELTASASHDLRTPLSSLRAMVDALEDGMVEGPEEINRYYATMRRELERLSRMIDDLFELARVDAGALRLDQRPVALQEVAAEVVDAMHAEANRRGVRLSLETPATELPPLLLDGARMERALANLVRNALEHTPTGGSVRLELDREGPCATVTVVDTGDGIAATDLPRIWDRFYRADRSRTRNAANAGGAGLGLAIVRGIVEAHGGSVGAQSSIGEGSRFSLHLPLKVNG